MRDIEAETEGRGTGGEASEEREREGKETEGGDRQKIKNKEGERYGERVGTGEIDGREKWGKMEFDIIWERQKSYIDRE